MSISVQSVEVHHHVAADAEEIDWSHVDLEATIEQLFQGQPEEGTITGTSSSVQSERVPEQPPALTDHHRKHLQGSGLSDESIAAAGFVSVTAQQAQQLGFPPWPGLLIPYPGILDYCRLRPDPSDRPGEDRPKYLSRQGSANHLYIPPGVETTLQNKTRALIITEGEKKALKASQEGFPTVGLSGVWNWKTRDEGVLPELKVIKWKDRPVYIAFDSDLQANPEVQAALRELVKTLEGFRATVRIVLLPAGPDGQKVGLDDFLVQQGAQALRNLLGGAAHLLDAVLTLIEPHLDPARLQARLEDVYRAAQMYPASIPAMASKIIAQLRSCGYAPPAAAAIIGAIKKVGRFVSARTESEKTPDNPEEMTALGAAEALLAEGYTYRMQPTLRFYRGEFYCWTGHHYTVVAESDLSARVMGWLQRNQQICKESFVRDVIANLKGLVHLDTPHTPPFRIVKFEGSMYVEPEKVLCCQNYVVPIVPLLESTFCPAGHSPEWFTLSSLPYDFDFNAKCPQWEQFLNQVLEGDLERIRLIQELFGYCLMGDLRQQKFFILFGEGSNGKSVVLEILEAMLGEENVSHLSLDQFSNRFALGCMEGKLANIYADLEEIDRVEEGLLKTLTAGEPVQIDQKYRDPRSMKPTAVLVFSANTVPSFRDRSRGIWRRLVLIPFEFQVQEAQQDKQLAARLKWELPGILNWALDGAERLHQQDGFSRSTKCEEAGHQHRHDSDPVLRFLEQCVQDDPNGSIETQRLYERYREWAFDNGSKPLNDVNFGKTLRRHKPHVTKIERWVNSQPTGRRKVRKYAGISAVSRPVIRQITLL